MPDVPINTVISRTGGNPKVYRGARDVQARAAVSQSGDSPALKKALARLDRTLVLGRRPKLNVPRGYYLNVRV